MCDISNTMKGLLQSADCHWCCFINTQIDEIWKHDLHLPGGVFYSFTGKGTNDIYAPYVTMDVQATCPKSAFKKVTLCLAGPIYKYWTNLHRINFADIVSMPLLPSCLTKKHLSVGREGTFCLQECSQVIVIDVKLLMMIREEKNIYPKW